MDGIGARCKVGEETHLSRLFSQIPRVEPDMRNNKRQTPLILAAEHGYYGATKLLLGTKGVDAAAVDDDKWNALSGAAWNGHAPCGTALDR